MGENFAAALTLCVRLCVTVNSTTKNGYKFTQNEENSYIVLDVDSRFCLLGKIPKVVDNTHKRNQLKRET